MFCKAPQLNRPCMASHAMNLYITQRAGTAAGRPCCSMQFPCCISSPVAKRHAVPYALAQSHRRCILCSAWYQHMLTAAFKCMCICTWLVLVHTGPCAVGLQHIKSTALACKGCTIRCSTHQLFDVLALLVSEEALEMKSTRAPRQADHLTPPVLLPQQTPAGKDCEDCDASEQTRASDCQ